MTIRKVYLTTLFAALASAMLAGCGGVSSKTTTPPPYEGAGYTDRELSRREHLLSKRDFSIEIASVKDARYPRTSALDAPDRIIYEYEPNDLLQGMTYRVPVLLGKYLQSPKRLKHYMVDVSIREMKTQIVTGTFFSGGRDGRYRAKLVADVLVRRPDSLVVVNQPLEVELYQPRRSYDGRAPSAEMDRARTYDLMEEAFRRAAEIIAWKTYKADGQHWDPVRDQMKADQAAARAAAEAAARESRMADELEGFYLEDDTMETAPQEMLLPPASEPWTPPAQDGVPRGWSSGS